MIVFGSGRCILATLLYLGKSGCNRAKVVVFGQKWLYSRKTSCIRAKVFVFDESACNRTEEVVFGQSGGNRARWWYLGKIVVFR